MASAVATHKLRANQALRGYVHNPTTATDDQAVAWVDMSLYGNFLTQLTFLSGTGILTFRIMASADAAGGSPVEVKAHAAPTAADAAGDQLTLECSSQELAALGTNLRYVAAQVDCDHADDIAHVLYQRTNPKFAQESLTPDSLIDGVAA